MTERRKFHDESDAFVHQFGSFAQLPFDLSKVFSGVCHIFGLDFVCLMRPKDKPKGGIAIVSGWGEPAKMRPMLEEVLAQVLLAEEEGIESEKIQ